MKISAGLIVLVGFHGVWGQKLPEEVRFSADGLRLISGDTNTYGFYKDTRIKTLELKFQQPDFWQQLLNNYQTKKEIIATLTYDGKDYPNVGVRFKGQTSYQRVTSQKKSFNITMDFVDASQDLEGYETLNLNNSFEDPSFMREVLYENITRSFTPSLKANWIHLKINGESWGLYCNVQALDGDYISQWFLSNDGTRWRCERSSSSMGGGGGFGAGTSSLNYLGEDTALYKPHYNLKKAHKPDPWNDLVNTTRALANLPLHLMEDSLRKLLDIDRTLWFLAKEIVFGDDDGYVNKGGMDYFIYWDKETGRIIPLEYDANSVMGAMTANWSPFIKENDNRFPLLNRLFKVPTIRQRYIAHVKHIIQSVLDSNYYIPKINTYYRLIDSFVRADNKKLMTYNQFEAARPALINYLKNRRQFLLSQPEINVESPVIEYAYFVNEYDMSNSPPNAHTEVKVRAKARHSMGISNMFLYFSTGLDGYFEKAVMRDDGMHGDSIGGDGIFTGTIPGHESGTYVRYYVEAVANNTPKTVSYLPAGAEHDVFIYQVNLAGSTNRDIVINEIMASNTKSVADQDGEYDDWIELHNKSETPVNISGWGLTDNPDNLDKYKFPAGTIVPAKGYLIVWADEDGKQAGYHANFKLSANGETLLLLDDKKYQVDLLSFDKQQEDVAFARVPNGTGPFVFQAHTFNKSNDLVKTDHAVTNTRINIYPNPLGDRLNIEISDNEPHTFRIYDIHGRLFFQDNVNSTASYNISELPNGIYICYIDQFPTKVNVLK